MLALILEPSDQTISISPFWVNVLSRIQEKKNLKFSVQNSYHFLPNHFSDYSKDVFSLI